MRNRLANARNEYQGKMPRVLCVCSAGLLRAPSIAWVLSNEPWLCNTRAAGVTEEYALIVVDQVLLKWADLIVCAEESHKRRVERMQTYGIETGYYREAAPVIALDIPDEYQTRDPVLISLISKKAEELLNRPIGRLR